MWPAYTKFLPVHTVEKVPNKSKASVCVSPSSTQTKNRSGTAYVSGVELKKLPVPALRITFRIWHFIFCHLSFSDPTVNRYRVQWSPEFCSHNGSRTQEKLVTQVTSQECVFYPPYRCEATFWQLMHIMNFQGECSCGVHWSFISFGGTSTERFLY